MTPDHEGLGLMKTVALFKKKIYCWFYIFRSSIQYPLVKILGVETRKNSPKNLNPGFNLNPRFWGFAYNAYVIRGPGVFRELIQVASAPPDQAQMSF